MKTRYLWVSDPRIQVIRGKKSLRIWVWVLALKYLWVRVQVTCGCTRAQPYAHIAGSCQIKVKNGEGHGSWTLCVAFAAVV